MRHCAAPQARAALQAQSFAPADMDKPYNHFQQLQSEEVKTLVCFTWCFQSMWHQSRIWSLRQNTALFVAGFISRNRRRQSRSAAGSEQENG